MPRRDFLKLAGAVGVCGRSPKDFTAGMRRVSMIVDPENTAASSGPAKRAAGQLRQALAAKGVSCESMWSARALKGSAFCVLVAGAESQLAKGFPAGAPLTSAESLRLTPGQVGRIPAVLVSAKDARGFVYGLLELAERVEFGEDPVAALQLTQLVEEKPANEVRCVSRYFCGELEDRPWYDDKAFWSGYLDRLVASRFNRCALAYGLECDFPRGVTDDYFHFAYPYLVDMPGYPDVRVVQLAATDGTRLATPKQLSANERTKNLEMLRFVAAETDARGLQFHLGIWTHAYEWTDSPNAYHRIEGLRPETHARYCRDALAIILKECPEIQGLTMRVHGESGIPEGSYGFWQTVFEAIAGAGRKIEIDMHAKGVDEKIIAIAAATGMPVKLGAKYSAEHQSLGYNQADIRALEIPTGNLAKTNAALFRVSSGARSFTRYGYSDFLKEGARYQLWFRLWPGTQRHLLSADPEMAAAYGRTASFCGAAGLDLMEPLTFKGREGSGLPGGRCAYADASLTPEQDWQKYDLYYRVWGRKLYNPDAEPETWRRATRALDHIRIRGPGPVAHGAAEYAATSPEGSFRWRFGHRQNRSGPETFCAAERLQLPLHRRLPSHNATAAVSLLSSPPLARCFPDHRVRRFRTAATHCEAFCEQHVISQKNHGPRDAELLRKVACGGQPAAGRKGTREDCLAYALVNLPEERLSVFSKVVLPIP